MLNKRTRGWLALRGLWGKKRSEIPPLAGVGSGQEEDLEEAEEEAREKKMIPKISEEELQEMMS